MNEINKYKLLTFVRYLGDAFFYPFFALYLKSTGLVEDSIGFILSLSPILSIVCNPFYAYLSKDINKTKKILSIITILEGIVIIIIPFCNNFYILSALAILLSITGSSHYGMLDSITSYFAKEESINYSSIRMFGSLAYIIATTLGGYVIKLFDYQVCFILSGILFIACFALYFIIIPFKNVDLTKDTVSVKQTIKSLIHNKEYILFVIFYVFLMGTMQTTDSFFSLYLETRGINSDIYGLVYSYYVIFEVVLLFILSKYGKNINNKNTTNSFIALIISSILLFIRLFVNYLNVSVYVVIALSALRGIGFALILHTAYTFVQNNVSRNEASLACMILTLSDFIYLALANNIFGNVIKNYSYSTFYLITSILALISLCLGVIRYILKRKELSK